MAYRKRKRPSRRRSYKRGKRKLTRRGAATRVQKCVRRFITAKRARRSMRAYARRRVSRSMNSLSSMSKTYSFSTYLERHMVPQDNFFTDDTNQKITSAGIICSSKNNTAPSFAGQCNLALRCGPGGFFNVAQPINSFSPLNSRVDDVFSQWKSFKIISTTYTFEPVDLGRGDLDTERQSAAVTNNATSHIDTKNQLAWFVIDQGNRDIDPLELCGQRAWQAPLPGPPPAGILNSGKVYSLGSDTGNLCDTSVKRRLFSLLLVFLQMSSSLVCGSNAMTGPSSALEAGAPPLNSSITLSSVVLTLTRLYLWVFLRLFAMTTLAIFFKCRSGVCRLSRSFVSAVCVQLKSLVSL